MDTSPLGASAEPPSESETAAKLPTPPPLDFRLLVGSVKDYAIFMLDPKGHVLTWNSGAERIKGYRADEIIGKHFSTFYPASDIAAGKCEMELEGAIAHGRFEDEGWRLRKDGSRFWANVVITAVYDDTGRLVGFAKVTRDLTERRRTEETLQRSEERFRLLVTSVKDYAIFMLDPDGRIASWNAGAERLKQYRSDEIIGEHFSVFYTREDIEAGKPERELATARAEERYEEEGFRLRKDGSRFWASVVLSAVHDEAGRLVGFAKVTRDLTERKRAEDERVRLAQAQEAIRMRDEFLSIASHELKTPLTALQLQLQAMGEQPESTERAVKRIERASRNAARLAALIETLLDVARITNHRLRLNTEHFDLREAVQETVERLQDDAARARCELRVLPGEGIPGEWDRLRVEQVVTNLVTNALKYGAGKPIIVAVDRDDDQARITVTDQGMGIAEEALARIFDRFERAVSMRNYGGLGLGLYIARQIVEAHGGTIEVASRPDEGATFTVHLPLAPPPQAAASPDPEEV